MCCSVFFSCFWEGLESWNNCRRSPLRVFQPILCSALRELISKLSGIAQVVKLSFEFFKDEWRFCSLFGLDELVKYDR